jgi:molecular chaperone GrpE
MSDSSAPQPAPAESEAAQPAAGEVVSIPAAEYEALRREAVELKERLLRQQADFDNSRKRLRREADEAAERAVVRFVRPLLVQLDNFSLALAAATPEHFQDFAQGVTMIQEGLQRLLGDSGITTIATEGRFDPALHEVLTEIEHETERGTIVAVHRSGWRKGEQVVRAAQVVVSKGSVPPAA